MIRCLVLKVDGARVQQLFAGRFCSRLLMYVKSMKTALAKTHNHTAFDREKGTFWTIKRRDLSSRTNNHTISCVIRFILHVIITNEEMKKQK